VGFVLNDTAISAGRSPVEIATVEFMPEKHRFFGANDERLSALAKQG
jgi:hypothetical protein